ncbi:MAG: hypothetical protein J7L15_08420 [Clostridiales bacterium]|nr:hypothetical protein [Clostridiales bacterium]
MKLEIKQQSQINDVKNVVVNTPKKPKIKTLKQAKELAKKHVEILQQAIVIYEVDKTGYYGHHIQTPISNRLYFDQNPQTYLFIGIVKP